jgi:hypothetical protein
MKQAQMLQEFDALPTEAQKLVAELVTFLSKEYRRSKSSRKKNAVNLLDEKFIGIWKDRGEMRDSNAYVRNLRKTEWH